VKKHSFTFHVGFTRCVCVCVCVCIPVAVACRLAINAAYNVQDLCESPIRIYFRRSEGLGAPLGSPHKVLRARDHFARRIRVSGIPSRANTGIYRAARAGTGIALACNYVFHVSLPITRRSNARKSRAFHPISTFKRNPPEFCRSLSRASFDRAGF